VKGLDLSVSQRASVARRPVEIPSATGVIAAGGAGYCVLRTVRKAGGTTVFFFGMTASRPWAPVSRTART
jgi:hypothetical protein